MISGRSFSGLFVNVRIRVLGIIISKVFRLDNFVGTFISFLVNG